jgi:signal peptidase I
MSLFSFRYRMNRCRHILHQAFKTYEKQGKPLELKQKLAALQNAIDAGDRSQASTLAKDVENYCKDHYKKSPIAWVFELVGALAVALIAAAVIRSMWFEPFEIPTGSMRPTFMEQDHLTVSKTQFGINVPFETKHFYFDPAHVQRTSTLIFSGDKIPLPDTDSTFLGIFPYKKRYVKRLMGKPQDTFYFYGGKVYALDSEGKQVEELLDSPWMEPLEHIPVLDFQGGAKQTGQGEIVLNYFNKPLARISRGVLGNPEGEIFNGTNWVQDNVASAQKPHDGVQTLSDLFGLGNYAMAQIYTKEELAKEGIKPPEDGVLFLVLRHTPNLDFTKGAKQTNRFPKVMLTVLPLHEEDLKTIQQAMYTGRFVVENEKAKPYSAEERPFPNNSPLLKSVPDGTYEFYFGKAYKVGFGGITSKLPPDHPLFNLALTQQLYNLGTNWYADFQAGNQAGAWPRRYAYFRNGDLYLMGQPLLKKDSPRLKEFIAKETKRQSGSAASDPYVAFIDQGPPKNTPAFYKAFGIKIPEKSYLVLGDNHAMSADSRIFGFVPEDNLQGVPDIIVWPPGNRLGHPAQKPYPLFVTPRLIVWALAAIVGTISYIIYRYRLRRRIEL